VYEELCSAYYLDAWYDYGYKDFVGQICDKFPLSHQSLKVLKGINPFILLELYERAIPAGDFYVDESTSGVTLLIEEAIANIDRSTLAAFLKQYRNRVAG
jgi:hypothetical protein